MRDQGGERAREGQLRKKAGERGFGFRGFGFGLGIGAQRILGGQRPAGRDGSPVSQLS